MTPERKQFLTGLAFAFSSAFFWATNYLSGRALMRVEAIDPLSLTLIRFVGATLLMFALGLALKKPMFAITKKQLANALIQGSIGMAAMSILLYWGQRTTGAVNSSIIMTSIPLMIAVFGFFTGEKMKKRQVLGMLVAAAGCFMVIKVIDRRGIHLGNFGAGDLLTFAAALCWTIYVLWGRRTLKEVDGFVYTAYVCLGAIPLLAVLETVFYQRAVLPVLSHHWLIVVYIILFPTVAAFFSWNQAQKLLPLPVLNVMQYLTPVSVLILSWPLLGETSTVLQIAGSTLVILGVGADSELLRRKKR